jgi:hypothetical protein
MFYATTFKSEFIYFNKELHLEIQADDKNAKKRKYMELYASLDLKEVTK